MQKPQIHHQSYGIKKNTGIHIPALFEDVGLDVSIESNPDYFHKKFETLTIDDAREIKEIHASKPLSAESPRVFVIEFHGITREAQNALLKVLEEPAPNNFFFLIMPSFDVLLPTLRSRLHTLDIEKNTQTSKQKNEGGNEKLFLKLSLKEKVTLADEIAQSISDEREAKHIAMEFIDNVERELHEIYSKEKNIEKKAIFSKKFEVIAKARTYLGDRAPSVKMLLEYVALSV